MAPPVSPARTLRKLFLTLFLRGRGARGLRKESAPKSVGTKLGLTLAVYALFGSLSLFFLGQPIFSLSLYLHAMTLMFLGMFVAAASGEVLFNKEEADILMHRPVTPRALLWAKVAVLVQVSLWLAGAFNLIGLLVGVGTAGGSWLFPPVHAISTLLGALFTAGCVVLVYQLCLRWFGRERLDALMTTAQVFMAVAMVVAGQAAPQLLRHFDGNMKLSSGSWWMWLLPPAWFAGFDDALAGHGATGSWALAAMGFVATTGVLWLAFGRLARDYETGLQTLNESIAKAPRQRKGRRWLDVMVHMPPLQWFLRSPASRASFILTAAYLVRDRDMKLRIYPGVAPMLVMPLIFLVQDRGDSGGLFTVAFAGTYLGLIPLLSLDLLRYSQHWQAADIFRVVPMPGPAPLSDGARHAVLWLLTAPVLAAYGLLFLLIGIDLSRLAMFVPGLIALPLYSLIPCLGGKVVPLSLPNEAAKSAGRGLQMVVVMIISFALSGIAILSWSGGWFHLLIIAEFILVAVLYAKLRASLATVRWPALE